MTRIKMDTFDLDNIVLIDLAKNRFHSSWDWDADARFAKAVVGLEREAEVLRMVCASAAPSAIRDAAAKSVDKAKRLRLAALRRLIADRYVRAYWVGLGAGGVNTFGVRRVRHYELTADGRKWVEERLGVKPL